RFYGIKDNTTMANGAALTESSLVDVTSSNTAPTQGWFFRLNTNEKVLAASNVFNMNVFFSGFTPTTTISCTSGSGDARLYAVQVQTGFAAINFSTGTALSSPTSSNARSATIGT